MRPAGWLPVSAVLGALAMSVALAAPPAPGGPSKASAENAKASSYAPQARSHNRAYGAPIQRPILAKRKLHKRHAEKPAPPK